MDHSRRGNTTPGRAIPSAVPTPASGFVVLSRAVKPRTRKRLRNAAVAILGITLVLGGLGYAAVHRAIGTRGPGEVQGGVAADFSLPDSAGTTVTLAGLTAHGPAVLVFYRGYW